MVKVATARTTTRPSRVLLVDDSIPLRDRLRDMIEERGASTVAGEAGTTADAIRLFRELRPDTVLLDLQLPDGSGYAVLESIRRISRNCRVIVMTGFADPEVRKRSLLLGADHFIDKTQDLDRLPELLVPRRSSTDLDRLPADDAAAMLSYQRMVSSMSSAGYACDRDGYIIAFNQAAAKLWGREPVLGTDRWSGAWRLFEISGKPMANEQSPMARAMQEQRAITGEEIVVARSDGSRQRVFPHPRPVFAPDGKMIGAVNMLDTTERQYGLKAAPRRDQDIAQAVLDSLTSQVAVLDSSGVILKVNEAWRLHSAQLPDEARRATPGRSYVQLSERHAQAEAPGAAAFLGGLHDVLNAKHDRYDGEVAVDDATGQSWFVTRVTRLVSDPLRCVVVTLVDNTARKAAELALAESRERWKFAVDGSGDGLWDTELPTGRTRYSRRWKELLGYAAHEIEDGIEECLSRLHPDDAAVVRSLYQRCLDGNAPELRAEVRMRHKNGDWLWVLCRGMVVAHALDGSPKRLLGTISDISERKTAEQTRLALESQLIESQRLEAVGTLASSIAHDFNNLVGAILGNVALARHDLPTDHSVMANLAQIEKAGLRARSLVRRIVSYGRRQPEIRQVQQLQPVLAETIDLLRATLPSGVTLRTHVTEEPISALIDATQLSQVLMNLGTNAWHALHGKAGHIDIGLELQDGARLSGAATLPRADSYAHLWVADEGCGIADDLRERIFDPFFTTKGPHQGTGLGLPVVLGIVQSHGGALTLESTLGRGSVFDIWIPIAPAEHVLAPVLGASAPKAPDERPARAHVLYIDDDETMLHLVERILPRDGMRVTCMASAAQALEFLSADPGDIDLVVSDLNMPERSGLDVIRAVRDLHPSLPVILASGDLSDDVRAQGKLAGAQGFVGKDQLYEKLGPEARRVLKQAWG